MKLPPNLKQDPDMIVAPYMGAWIEIQCIQVAGKTLFVAPYMGAWIEIHPLSLLDYLFYVAPYMGAWIEIA